VGKLLHVMRWSRPDVLNAVSELSRFMMVAALQQMKALYRVMSYCVATPNRALELKSERKWNGSPTFQFRIRGKADSTFTSCPMIMRSVGGQTTLLEGAPVIIRSKMESIVVALSVTESELISSTECAQDMLYSMRIVKSIGLQVEKPMILEIDNKGMVDIANNRSVGDRTRHMNTRYYFLRELKEVGV
jgi:hypothetical protein